MICWWSKIFVLLLNFKIIQTDSKTLNKVFTWSYRDQTNWSGERCQEGGHRQSPIDIQTDSVLKDYKQRFIKYGNLVFSGYKSTVLHGINNGHTIQFSTGGELSTHPTVKGGPLQHTYRLEQLHFHWLSEHAIDGKKYPMELHFVHVRADLTVEQALLRRDGLAIVAVMCETFKQLSEPDEERVQALMSYVPMLRKTGDKVMGIMLNLNQLLPDTYSYYTYEGSLTSPKCNEVVTWIIFESTLHLSVKQYNELTSVGNGQLNYRYLQPMREIVVYRPAPDTIYTTPFIAQIFKDMYSSVSSFFSDLLTATDYTKRSSK